MPRPTPLLRAVAAGSLLTVLAPLAVLSAAPTASAAGSSTRVAEEHRPTSQQVAGLRARAPGAEEKTPLSVQLSSIAPAEIPRHGPIRIEGVVTNRSDERWTGINLHAFLDDSPITSVPDLDEAAQLPATAVVGDRITTIGMFDPVGGLDPGQSAPFSIRLGHSSLGVIGPGVYWFGVHALGQSPSQPSDGVADGRARTFMPYLPGVRRSVDVSLVVPVRRLVSHTPQGRIAGAGAWAKALSAGGDLAAATTLGEAAGTSPLTWVVDPAVIDAVRRLVAGNPARNLGDTIPEGGSPEPEPTDEPSVTEGASPTVRPELPKGTQTDNPAIDPGKAWLSGLRAILERSEVLSLPYGDLDVSSAAFHAPDLIPVARKHSGDRMAGWDIPTESVRMGDPTGYLDPDSLRLPPEPDRVILGSQMFGADAPSTAQVDGLQVAVASTPTATGGPGPDDPLTALAMRQRILAEAAVRLLSHPGRPLIVVLPQGWAPADLDNLFGGSQAGERDSLAQDPTGLEVPWVRLTSLSEATARPGRERRADRLRYPDAASAARLPAANFAAAEALMAAGRRMQDVLTRNDQLSWETTGEALTSLSTQARPHRDNARVRTDASAHWLQRRLHGIKVTAPPGVTLSSKSGGFAATLKNRLDHPVTVSLHVETDPGLRVELADSFDLVARGRRTVNLTADVLSPGVHYVRLSVTDAEGRALGSKARVPIRSTQVSQVIWVILAAGVGLMLVARVLGVVRTRRRAGHQSGAAGEGAGADEVES